jgi:hypothetical protein
MIKSNSIVELLFISVAVKKFVELRSSREHIENEIWKKKLYK